MLSTASLKDALEIKGLLDASPAEILPVPMVELRRAIADGKVVWDDGVAIIYRPCTVSVYMGGWVGEGSWQILQLVARTKGDGSAQRAMAKFYAAAGQLRNVFLLVKAMNERGIRFYEKEGFKVVRTLRWPTFSSHLMLRMSTARITDDMV